MLNAEENRLTRAQAALENIDIPEIQLDQAISAGITKGKRKQKKNLLLMRTLASAAILIFAFTALLRTSETFASYVTSIPGMEKIVELVRFDKGLTAAIENDFAQKIGVSDEHEGLKITLDSAIVDEQMMVLFYKIDSSAGHKEIAIDKIQLTDAKGKELELSSSFSMGPIDLQKKGESVHEMTYYFYGKVAPENMKLSFRLAEGRTETGELRNKLADTWVLPFSIDKEAYKDKREIIEVNKTVSFEGQKVTVEKVSIYPTRIGVTVDFDEKNTKQIFAIEDLRIVDESGEEWATIANGISASHISADKQEVYLQSNFFKNPKELYLKFSSIRALDKDELTVVVDPDQLKIIERPRDGRLLRVEREGEDLKFTYLGDRGAPFQHAIDSEGKQIGSGRLSVLTSEGVREQQILIPYFGENPAPGLITLQITDYATKVKGDANIKVK
ncbi:DUF4179 domain-containing protein [Heyndrickxia sp. MSNUG]|uniref:DUF4179 domain-containing protein n=1 Tax=Heyndrickxia sp. MSNUG TaxID=3136677 RepID=UPI003C2DE830